MSATLDVLILPQEPSPGWALPRRVRPGEEGGGGAGDARGYWRRRRRRGRHRADPPVDDDDEGALPPLLAIDRVRLVATRENEGRREERELPGAGARGGGGERAAPFVPAAFDPGAARLLLRGTVHGSRSPGSRRWRAPWTTRTTRRRRQRTTRAAEARERRQPPLPAVVTLLDSPAPYWASRQWATRWRRGWFSRLTSGTPRRCTRRRRSAARRRGPGRAPRRRRRCAGARRRHRGERGAPRAGRGAGGADSARRVRPQLKPARGQQRARARRRAKERTCARAPRARAADVTARGWASRDAPEGRDAMLREGSPPFWRRDAGAAARAPKGRRLARMASPAGGEGDVSRGRLRRRRARSA